MKVIAFDLDETLGHFSDLNVIYSDLQLQHGRVNQHHFNYLCDHFPEFFRPHIFEIINYICEHRMPDDKIVIYTNNNGPKSWTNHIKNYIEYKLNRRVFDTIICSHKIGNVIIEPNRTTQNKIYTDLIRCTGVPYGTQICFIDDQHHEGMSSSKFVFYIRPKPYLNYFDKQNILTRLFYCKSLDLDIHKTASSLEICDDNFKSQEEEEIDTIVSRRIFQHVSTFLQ